MFIKIYLELTRGIKKFLIKVFTVPKHELKSESARGLVKTLLGSLAPEFLIKSVWSGPR